MRKGIIIAGGIAAAVVLIGIGAAANGGSKSEASAPTEITKTVTVTAPAAPPKTVTVTAPPVTVTAPAPAPVTVTAQPAAPAAPAASADPAGPKKNGDYLIGAQIATGNWQCADGGNEPSWSTYDASHSLVDIDISTIATVADDAYSVTLKRCSGVWTKA